MNDDEAARRKDPCLSCVEKATEIARLNALWEAEHATVIRVVAERDALKAELDEALSPARHCKDCCCARVWAALPADTDRKSGVHVSQYVEALVADLAAAWEEIEQRKTEASVRGAEMMEAAAREREVIAFIQGYRRWSDHGYNEPGAIARWREQQAAEKGKS